MVLLSFGEVASCSKTISAEPTGGCLRAGPPRTEERPLPNPDSLKRENEALRDRISKLSAASLRISASLDLGTVLREAVESACQLTGARFGVIATIDEYGQIQDVVTAGLTPEEEGRLMDWPNGVQLFEHFRDLSGPVRLRDLPDYLQSLAHV